MYFCRRIKIGVSLPWFVYNLKAKNESKLRNYVFFVICLCKQVLDRLFLWLFMIASVLGTFVILCEAPSLYDDTQPIDTELSIIAKQIFNLSLHKGY